MSQPPAEASMGDALHSRLDVAVEVLLIALLVFMPLAFGVVQAWSELAVIALAWAMALCFALRLVLHRDARLVWSWAYLPAALFLLLGLFQLVPLPASAVRILSPGTASTKAWLLGDLASGGGALDPMTLTFYPLATRHDLRLLAAAAAVFVVVLNVYRRPEQIKRLLGAVAIIGGGIAALALAQHLFGNGLIYWFVPTPGGTVSAGPFVCHSHYGQFMNLSIGAALGLLLVKVHESFPRGALSAAEVVDHLSAREMRAVWWLAAFIVLGAVTVFLSLTRGGMASLLLAAAVTTLALASRRALRSRGWIMVGLALAGFICVLYVGFEAVYERFATLHEQGSYQGRWQILRDLTVPFSRFPLLGTGLGSHQVIYPMFDRSTATEMASHAENEYAQVLEETGVVGLVLCIAFLVVVWRSYVHNAAHLRFPIRSASFGLGFGLIAAMVHSFSDFGQHLPANHGLTAISCALLIGLAQMGSQKPVPPRWWSVLSGGRFVRVPAALALAVVAGWMIVKADDARRAEAHWRGALAREKQLAEKKWQGTNDEYAALLSEAAAAAAGESGNVLYRHWLNVYRWRSISRLTDPETGDIVLTPQAVAFARRIVGELHETRAICPTFGPTYCFVGQLEKFVLDEPVGGDHIRKGYALAPTDPTVARVAALLDVAEGRLDDSLEKFRRCLALGGTSLAEVVSLYLQQAKRPDLALAIAGQSPEGLQCVAGILSSDGEHRQLAADVRSRAVAALKAQCDAQAAPAGLLATVAAIYCQEQDYGAAIECYRRALALDYGQVGWRFELAKILAKKGLASDAIHQARICLRLRPQMKAAQDLIASLSTLSGGGSE